MILPSIVVLHIPIFSKKRWYFSFFLPLIPTLFKHRGYHAFFPSLIPTLFKCRGYHAFFLSLIPTLFKCRGYHVLFPPQVPTQAIPMRIDSHCQGSVVHGAIPGHPGVL